MSLSVYKAVLSVQSSITALESIRQELVDSEEWSGELGRDIADALAQVETDLQKLRNDALRASKPWRGT